MTSAFIFRKISFSLGMLAAEKQPSTKYESDEKNFHNPLFSYTGVITAVFINLKFLLSHSRKTTKLYNSTLKLHTIHR